MKILCFVAAFFGLAIAVQASDIEQNYPISELYVLSSQAAELDGDRLTLRGLDPKVIWFTDRPARHAGRADTDVFIANWPVGDDSFEVDPPNGALVGRNDDEEEVELVLEFMDPVWNGPELTLRVAPIEAPLPRRLSLRSTHIFLDNKITDAMKQAWCGHECFKTIIDDRQQ